MAHGRIVMIKLFNTAFFLLVFTACSSAEKSASNSQQTGTRPAQRYLEQGYAEYRSSLVSGVKYNLTFDLTNDTAFSGTSRITFQLNQPKDISVDFYNGTVSEIKVNSAVIPVA